MSGADVIFVYAIEYSHLSSIKTLGQDGSRFLFFLYEAF